MLKNIKIVEDPKTHFDFLIMNTQAHSYVGRFKDSNKYICFKSKPFEERVCKIISLNSEDCLVKVRQAKQAEIEKFDLAAQTDLLETIEMQTVEEGYFSFTPKNKKQKNQVANFGAERPLWFAVSPESEGKNVKVLRGLRAEEIMIFKVLLDLTIEEIIAHF